MYALTQAIGAGLEYDDDVVFAAAWLHDLGVFVGHRPEDPVELARWDHVAYVVEKAPGILESAGFATEKIPAVLEAIRTHQPKDEPRTMEAVILRDADILEQLGAIGIARTLCKVGRDTRYATFTPAVEVLRRALVELPGRSAAGECAQTGRTADLRAAGFSRGAGCGGARARCSSCCVSGTWGRRPLSAGLVHDIFDHAADVVHVLFAERGVHGKEDAGFTELPRDGQPVWRAHGFGEGLFEINLAATAGEARDAASHDFGDDAIAGPVLAEKLGTEKDIVLVIGVVDVVGRHGDTQRGDAREGGGEYGSIAAAGRDPL